MLPSAAFQAEQSGRVPTSGDQALVPTADAVSTRAAQARLGPCGERSFARDLWHGQERLAPAILIPPVQHAPSIRRPLTPTGKSSSSTGGPGPFPPWEGTGTTTKRVLPSQPSGAPCCVTAILAVPLFSSCAIWAGAAGGPARERAFND